MQTIERLTMTAAARAQDIVKVYGEGAAAVRALDGVTIGFERERFSAIMGPSGSGKWRAWRITSSTARGEGEA